MLNAGCNLILGGVGGGGEKVECNCCQSIAGNLVLATELKT